MHQPLPDVDPDLLDDGGLRLARHGPMLAVWLDRPEVRNAQSPATWRALAAVGAAVLEPPLTAAPHPVRVVVLAGAGESFSSGIDLSLLNGKDAHGLGVLHSALAALGPAALDDMLAQYQAGFTWLADPRIITIAAVQGHAVGAGFQLALACDLRVLADDAQLAMREVSFGLVPDLTGTSRLVQAIGYARALELCVTGRWVAAAEAVRLGIATLAVPREDLWDTVIDLVAAVTEPPLGAVQQVKGLLQCASVSTVEQQHAQERRAQAACLATITRLPDDHVK